MIVARPGGDRILTGPFFRIARRARSGMLTRMRARSTHLASVSVALVLTATPAIGQGAPPLPRIALDEFPATARAAVSRAYADAAARPSDAAAAGALGRVLHAWEQWDGAHQAYDRALVLAPTTFEWPYLDGLVLQRLARYDEAAVCFERALAASPDYLPARVRLAESLLDAGDVARSATRFQALLRGTCSGSRRADGTWTDCRARGPARRRHRAFREGGRPLSPSSAPPITRWRSPIARSDGPTMPAGRWPSTPGSARAGRRSTIRCATAWRRFATTPRPHLQRGVRLAESGDVAGAIAAHEAALAQDPSRVAGAHEPGDSIRPCGQFREGRRTLPVGRRPWRRHRRRALRLRCAARPAREVGRGRGRLSQGARGSIRRMCRRATISGSCFERQRQFEAAAAEYRLAVESQPSFRLARFNLGTHAPGPWAQRGGGG